MQPLIDKIALIHIVDRKVLATVSRGKTVFYFPGGKREMGETDERTLIREIKEELDVDIIPGSIRFYGRFSAQAHDRPGVMMTMACYFAHFVGEPRPCNEVERLVWVTSDDAHWATNQGKILIAALHEQDLID